MLIKEKYMNNKFPTKIPWSMIDTDALRQSIENLKRENANRNWKPYLDLSERKEKQKDHTKVFKGIYDKVRQDLHSGDTRRKALAQLKMHESFQAYSGRPLTEKELYNIIVQCEMKKPRMKMNAFGGLYTTKVINNSDDLEIK